MSLPPDPALPHIDMLTRQLFDVFDNRNSRAIPWQQLRSICLPHILIIKNVDGTCESLTLDSFIAPRESLLRGGRLQNFHEYELHSRTDIYGHIAQRFCHYEKTGELDGVAFTTRGWKSIQFVHGQEGWKICALIWDDEAAA